MNFRYNCNNNPKIRKLKKSAALKPASSKLVSETSSVKFAHIDIKPAARVKRSSREVTWLEPLGLLRMSVMCVHVSVQGRDSPKSCTSLPPPIYQYIYIHITMPGNTNACWEHDTVRSSLREWMPLFSRSNSWSVMWFRTSRVVSYILSTGV